MGNLYTARKSAAEVAAFSRATVLLHSDEHDVWLHGSIDDVIAFQNRSF